VKAVILVGGLGTRLRPLTFSIPKPLLPVGEKPLLQIVLEQLRGFGVDEVILATGYQAELIHAFCGDGSRFGLDVSYVHEEEALGTAGPLSLVRDRVADGERFLLMNGDVLTRLDFSRLFDFAKDGAYELTVGYTRYVYESPFGVLSVDGDLIRGIVEKPTTEYPVSAGIYVVGSSALELVPDGFFTMPELIVALIERARPVGAFHIDELWIGLETVARFDEAIRELDELSGEVERL
jgi:NDP-sugar pyrophosphorylase family protein